MKTLKKTAAIFLVLVLLLSALPFVSVSAQSASKELILNETQKIKLKGDDVVLSFVPEIDGWYEFSSVGNYDTYATLSSDDSEEIFDDDSGKDWNFKIKEKLYTGQTYYLSVNSYEAEYIQFSVSVSVVETIGVESVLITKYPDDMTCIKDYEYQTVDMSGLEAEFTFTDGTVELFCYDDSVDFTINGDQVIFNFDYDENDEYYCEMKCGDAKERIYFTVIESAVDRIELVTEKPFFSYEKTNGVTLENGNYFYAVRIPYDAVLNVYYKDGSMEEVRDFRYGGTVEIYDSQKQEPWGVGTNYFTVAYLGVETQVPFEVIATPIKAVKVNSAPNREYVYADEEWGYLNEVGRYEFWPEDLRGLSFTVTYNDGTTETFDDTVIDMDKQTIAGEEYTISGAYVIKAGKAAVTLTFKGYEIKYNVNVIESPVRNIEVVWGPDNCYYEQRFEPVFDGTQVRLTFKDGTEKVITMSDENTTYGDGQYLSYTLVDGDIKINIYKSLNEFGDVCAWFSYLDKGALYDGFYYEENREIADIKVDNFTLDGDDMVVTVTYTDSSVDTLNFDMVSSYDFSNGNYRGYAKTERGIAEYTINEVVRNDEVVSYNLEIFDKTINIPNPGFKLGDVDLDGTMSVMDATAISRHLAYLDTLSSKRLELSDVDMDGYVSVMDATEIQMILAEIIDKL